MSNDQVVSLVLRVDESGKFVGEIKKGDKALHDLGDAAKRTGKETKDLGRNTGDLSTSLLSAERAASVLKIGLATLGIASVGALFSGTIDSARGFAAALGEVSTLLASTGEMTGLRRELQEISIEFGKLPEAEAKAFYQIVSAGAETAAERMALLRTSNRLAVGGITEVEVAADGLTSTLNAFGDAVGSSDEVSDKFFATMKGGKTTIGEISSSIGSVAPLAAQLDVSLDEVLATVIAVTKGGDSTSKAMKGMAQAMAAILKPSGEAKELAAELGIEFDAASLATKGWAGFLDHLVDKTDASADKLALLFGGTEALLPVLTLTGKGAENFANGLDDVANSAGDTEEALRRVTEGVSAADHNFNQFSASMTVIATELGDPLINTLAPAAKAVADNLFEIIEVGSVVMDVLIGLAVAKGLTLAFTALTASTTGAAVGFQLMSTFGAVATTQLVAQTVATNAAAVATRGLALASKSLGGPWALAIGAATTALLLYQGQAEETVIAQRDLAGETKRVTDAFRDQATEAEKAALRSLEVQRNAAQSLVTRLLGQMAEATTADEIHRLSVALEIARDAALAGNLAIIQTTNGVTALGEAAGETSDALALTSDELTAYEKLLATLDPIGTAVADYRQAVALLDKALATGNIPNQAEYNELLAALDDELASVLDQKPAAEIQAWAAAQDDLTNATIANNAAGKVWVENHKDAVQKLAEFREGLREEIELSTLTQEQREEELIVRELLNLAKEAGIELTEEQARVEAEAITVANRSAVERERALNKNLDLYRRFIDEVEGGFKDAFKDAFKEGEGGFKRLIDGFENLFLDMLAELAFQAIAKPIIVPVLQSIGTGFFGLSNGQVSQTLGNQGLGTGGLGTIPGIGGNIQTGAGGGGGFDLSGLTNIFSGGGLYSQTLQGIGDGISSFIGIEAAKKSAPSILGSAAGNLPYAALGGLAANLLGLGSGNQLIDGGLSTLGGLGGAALGAQFGAVGGPIGAAIGAFVGIAAGTLFKKKPSVGQVIGAQFGPDGGVAGTGTDNGGSASAAVEFGDQISNVLSRILAVTGAEIDNNFVIEQSQANGLMVNRLGNRGYQTFGDDLVAALQFALEGNTSGGEEVFENLLATSDASTVEELVALLEGAQAFQETLDGLTAVNDNLTLGEQAIQNLAEQMQALRDKALEFGFETSQVDTAENMALAQLATEFDEGISSALLNALDPVRAQAVAMVEQQETRVRDAIALGGDLAELEKLHLLERRDFLRQLTEEQRESLSGLIDLTDDFAAQLAGIEQSLASTISAQFNSAATLARAYQAQATALLRSAGALEAKRIDLRFGSTSTLSPLQQLNEARTIMEGLSAQAFEDGDADALAELPSAVARFVEASAAYNADNAQFVNDFNQAQLLLEAAAALATSDAEAALSQVDLLVQQSDLLAEILNALSAPSPDAELLQSQLDRLTELNGQLATDLTVNVGGFDAFLEGQANAETLLAQLVGLASNDLNEQIGSQAEILAAERIAAIETASARAVAEARAAAQAQIDAALASAAAAEAAANEARATATVQYENSLVGALSAETVYAGRRSAQAVGEGIDLREAQELGSSSTASQLAFLNPERLLALAEDDVARSILLQQFRTWGVPGYVEGGLIGGIGSGTSDSNLIKASRGEFMIRSAAVDHYGVEFFDALNARQVGAAPANDRGGDLTQLSAGLDAVRGAIAEIGGAIVAAVEEGTTMSEETGRAVKQSVALAVRRAS